MAEIVNLNRFRKAKAKAEADKQATVNRAKFGRTKAEKDAERKRADKETRDLDGHERDDEP